MSNIDAFKAANRQEGRKNQYTQLYTDKPSPEWMLKKMRTDADAAARGGMDIKIQIIEEDGKPGFLVSSTSALEHFSNR